MSEVFHHKLSFQIILKWKKFMCRTCFFISFSHKIRLESRRKLKDYSFFYLSRFLVKFVSNRVRRRRRMSKNDSFFISFSRQIRLESCAAPSTDVERWLVFFLFSHKIRLESRRKLKDYSFFYLSRFLVKFVSNRVWCRRRMSKNDSFFISFSRQIRLESCAAPSTDVERWLVFYLVFSSNSSRIVCSAVDDVERWLVFFSFSRQIRLEIMCAARGKIHLESPSQ